MSDPITATAPTAIEATYDRWAIQAVTIAGDGCCAFGETAAAPVTAAVTLVKARVRPDGTWERSPLPADTVTTAEPDVYAQVAAGTDLGKALAAALAAVQAAAVLAAAGRL